VKLKVITVITIENYNQTINGHSYFSIDRVLCVAYHLVERSFAV